MTNIPSTQVADGVPTYIGRGDPAGRFADYYPAWVDNLADDVTLEGSMLDGAVQGADAVRALVGGARQLYDPVGCTNAITLRVRTHGAARREGRVAGLEACEL
jgi:hypothetical protein